MKQSFKKYLQKCELPIISLNVLGIKLNFLVDSGANKNQISEAAFEIVKETEYYKETFAQYQGKNRLSGVGGNVVQTKVLLGYFLDRKRYASEFGVMPGNVFDLFEKDYNIKVAGVLGTNFLACHNMVIDYAEMAIYTKKI